MLYASPGEVDVHGRSAGAKDRLTSMMVFRKVLFFHPDAENATGEDNKLVAGCGDGPMYVTNGVEGGACVIAAEDPGTSSLCTLYDERMSISWRLKRPVCSWGKITTPSNSFTRYSDGGSTLNTAAIFFT